MLDRLSLGKLAQLLTQLESKNEIIRQTAMDSVITSSAKFASRAFSKRISICGTPGAGKSTLIESLGMEILAPSNDRKPKKLGVFCVDPSSEISGGSILGDKTRMVELSAQENAYIRPLPSLGILGGLGGLPLESIIALENAGFSYILLESVGLGQGEIHARHLSDILIVVMGAHGSHGGDDIQLIKKGLLEYADIVVLHKADLWTEYQRLTWEQEYRSQGFCAISVSSAPHPKGSRFGHAKLLKAIDNCWDKKEKSGELAMSRIEQKRRCSEEELFRMLKLLSKDASIKLGDADLRRRSTHECAKILLSSINHFFSG